jgi:hypothetical protein
LGRHLIETVLEQPSPARPSRRPLATPAR